ncbi:MAG TPA: hypothetical protein VHB79_26475 [Polyangiaceae bacterium]|nr:hypothetical protein [Polyangiaceae bacterium]
MKSKQPVSSSSNTEEPARRWYGWQTFAADGAAVALAAAAVPLGAHAPYWPAEALGYTSAATYALGGPVIHLVQRQPLKAAGSFGLRVGLPFAVYALLEHDSWSHCPAKNEGEDEQYCQPKLGTLLGVLAAGVAASAIDGAVLAWKPIETERVSSLMPLVSVDRDRRGRTGLTVGLSAAF